MNKKYTAWTEFKHLLFMIFVLIKKFVVFVIVIGLGITLPFISPFVGVFYWIGLVYWLART